MEGKVLLAIGGCAVVAAVTYILQGGKKTGHKKKEQLGIFLVVIHFDGSI